MAAHCELKISLADSELFGSTVQEYVREFEDAVCRCYDCGDDFCAKHAAMRAQMVDDATALAIGMIRIEID